MKLNKGTWDSRNETSKKKIYETKRNFTFDETKRNETKFRCLFWFAKQAKFRETICLFRFVSCFAKQKKGCEMETQGSTSELLKDKFFKSFKNKN
jgi:hypothetical protein